MRLHIPATELQIDFIRSGGKGGQNVNKLATKAQLRWGVNQSNIFSAQQKQLITRHLRNKMNDRGQVLVTAQEERTQLQNKKRAIEKLERLVSQALLPRKHRLPTVPTTTARERRLRDKKVQARKKALRREKID